MNRYDVKTICDASMLDYDEAALESLSVIGKMMEEVVQSELCVGGEQFFPCGEALLRSDEVKCEYTRDEMLGGVGQRNGAFAVVPRVIR